MNQEEIERTIAAQEEEEKKKNTFSKAELELIVNQFALMIIKANGLKIDPTEVKFVLEEYQTNASFAVAGNPVVFHLRVQDLWEALVKKGKLLHDFKRLIESSLRVVPKLKRSLAVIPASDYIKWNEDLKKYKWHSGSDTDFLPKLLPDSEIHYDISLRIIATHIKTDTKIIVSDRNMDLVKLQRFAREILSEEVLNPNNEKEEDEKESKENSETNSSQV